MRLPYFLKTLLLGFLFVLLSTNLLFAEDLLLESDSTDIPLVVIEAFANTAFAEKTDLAFTKSKTEDGKISIERFDPRAKTDWTLISIDGQAPDQSVLEKYNTDLKKSKQAAEESNKDQENDRSIGFDFEDPSSVAEVGSWKLIEENAKDIIYGFKPKIESKEDKKFLPFVDGRLTIDAQTKTIKQYQLSNSKPFKPAVVAKIHKFLLQLDFLKVDTDMYYLSKVTMNINGRAMLKRFQQSSLVEYSEFERVK